MNVAAVIVTRGDIDLTPALESLPSAWEVVVWENGSHVTSNRPAGWVCERDGYRYELAEPSLSMDGGTLDPLTGATISPDLAVYGRYAAIDYATADVIFVQDDDCILAPESFDALLAAYQPGHVVANMPERFRVHYPDSCLVGFGAIFDRDLPERAFTRFSLSSRQAGATTWGADGVDGSLFNRTCDVVFTTLTPRILLDVDYADREFASAPNRMWKQREHFGERQRMLDLARQVRDAVPA